MSSIFYFAAFVTKLNHRLSQEKADKAHAFALLVSS